MRARKNPGVRGISVLCAEDQPGMKHLVAYIVADPAQIPEVADLRAFVGRSLPGLHDSVRVRLPAGLPHTPNGKNRPVSSPARIRQTRLAKRRFLPLAIPQEEN